MSDNLNFIILTPEYVQVDPRLHRVGRDAPGINKIFWIHLWNVFKIYGKLAHLYTPESAAAALCMSRWLVVDSPFSITRETPPRGES